jgi:hypothetical protein
MCVCVCVYICICIYIKEIASLSRHRCSVATARVRARRLSNVCWRMLTYAAACRRMLIGVWRWTGARMTADTVTVKRMLTYADVCWRMLTYADVCRRVAMNWCENDSRHCRCQEICWRMLSYADVCWRMQACADEVVRMTARMLTYADACRRVRMSWCGWQQRQSRSRNTLTYADVCWRMLTYADVCRRVRMSWCGWQQRQSRSRNTRSLRSGPLASPSVFVLLYQ